MIMEHNNGKMDESGELVNGSFVMGVNRFTDVDVTTEIPMGYNKAFHPDWSSQIMVGDILATERRRLGGLESYQVRDRCAFQSCSLFSMLVILTEVHPVITSFQKSPDFEMEDVSRLPEAVDWEAAGHVNPIVSNQQSCGGCWSFAATACIESHLSISTGEAPLELSEQNLLECSPNPEFCGGTGQCQGATIELAYNYVADQTISKKGGMFSLSDLQYQPIDETCDGLTDGKSPVVGIEGWVKLPKNDYKAIMNAVAKVGPVGLAVAAGKWALYEKGVFETTDSTVNHAVVLVGYGVDSTTGEKFWKIRNSWGSGFGESGYIRIKRSDDDGTNCGLDKDPLVGVDCALDNNGEKRKVKPVKVCGTSAVLFDASYPTGVKHLN